MLLTEQQEEAKNKILEWFNAPRTLDNQVFTLAGYAGTGKTFLVSHIVKNVLGLDDEKVAYIAPTGKAASVLVQKGIPSASTLHRLIYTVKEDDETDEKGKRKPIFYKKKEIGNYSLIILDEVSMVSDRLMGDLLSYNIPVLCCGDPGQLPPIMDKNNPYLVNPDYTLTEIVRQSEDNPIIQIATKARRKEFIREGKYGNDVLVINIDRLSEKTFSDFLLKADQVICGKNSTRIDINNLMRRLLGHTSETPENGEKIICCMNNYDITLDKEYPLVNGLIGELSNYTTVNDEEYLCSFDFKADFLDTPTKEIVADSSGFTQNDFVYDRHQRIYKLDDGTITKQRSLFKKTFKYNEAEYLKYKQDVAIELKNRKKVIKDFQISQFFYGYCISAHKSQGSEWDKVVVIDESNSFPSCREKWLYTAVTRAKKKLVIIKI